MATQWRLRLGVEKQTIPEPFPKSRKTIADAIEEAIFDAFGLDPPEDNSRPIRSAGKEKADVTDAG